MTAAPSVISREFGARRARAHVALSVLLPDRAARDAVVPCAIEGGEAAKLEAYLGGR
jgi:hypothetical protein